MATIKITALTALAAASITATDLTVVVDDIGGIPATKKATIADLRTALLGASGAGWTATDYLGMGAGTIPSTGMLRVGQGAITADAPLVNSTATWNNVAITFRHLLVNITDTASAAASLFADFQIAGASKWSVTKAGAVTQAAALTVSAGGATITAGGLTVSAGTTAVQALTATTITAGATIASTVGDGASFRGQPTTATQGSFLQFINTGGTLDVGLDNATASLFGTAGNYGTVIYRPAATGFAISRVATVDLSISAAGAVTMASGLTVTTGGLTVSAGTTAVQALTATTGVFAGALSGVTTLSLSSTLTMTAAASKLIPGATSFSHRNAADSADNLLITDAGAVTSRSTLTVTAGGLTVTGASTITGTLGGVTTLTCTTVTATSVGGTLTTAAQPNITSVGVLATPHMTSAVVDSGGLTVTAGGLTVSAGVFTVGAIAVQGGSTLNMGSGLLQTAASVAGFAGLNIPHGTAPTAPVNGDLWTTSLGAFVRINGVTKSINLT